MSLSHYKTTVYTLSAVPWQVLFPVLSTSSVYNKQETQDEHTSNEQPYEVMMSSMKTNDTSIAAADWLVLYIPKAVKRTDRSISSAWAPS